MSFKQLDSAIAFAATAHAGQIRKFDGLPYITHPIAVMQLVFNHARPWTEDMLVAAVLHDVVEDTPVNIETIERRFGIGVAGLVFDLTDQFMNPAFGNRAFRKDAERQRQAKISPQAQTIKYADLIHNTESIVAGDPGFACVYLKEKEALLAIMREGDARLLDMAEFSLRCGQSQLVQYALEKADEHTHTHTSGTGGTTAAAPPVPAAIDPADTGPAPGLAGVASIAR